MLGGPVSKYLLFSSFIALAAGAPVSVANAQDGDEDQLVSVTSDTTDPVDGDEDVLTVVTGTRLSTADPSVRIEVIDADDIEARGLATVEDIIRSIPQNVSSVNSANNTNLNPDFSERRFGPLGIGVSKANLGGFGTSATLVLVNGRRLAGTPGEETFAANLRDIPASAIERVEILQDGASAIYGSDAVGGVINIILKKSYNSLTLSARYENSSSDAHSQRYSANLGKAWRSGGITVSGSFTRTEPVSNAELGYTSRDQRSRYAGMPVGADFRDLSQARAGIIRDAIPNPFFDPNAPADDPFASTEFFPSGPLRILPPGFDGTEDWTENDLLEAAAFNFGPLDNPDRDVDDYTPLNATSTLEDISIVVGLNQRLLNDRLNLRGEFFYTRSESKRALDTLGSQQFLVPASNAFNQLGQAVFVSYNPLTELQSGVIPAFENEVIGEQTRYTIGFDAKLTESIEWVFDYSNAKSTSDGRRLNFVSQVSQNAYPDADAINARLNDLLSSADPSVALNPFGEGTAQNDSINEFVLDAVRQDSTSIERRWSSYVRGDLFGLPAGPVKAVIGAEFSTRGNRDQAVIEGGAITPNDRGIGSDPDQDSTAFFGELSVPLISSANAKPWAKALTLTGQIRRDRYTSSGFTVEPNLLFERELTQADFTPVETAFERWSPAVGLFWSPNDDLSFRVRYSTGFVAPSFSDLFTEQQAAFEDFVIDPLIEATFGSFDDPDFDFEAYDAAFVLIPNIFTSNPNLLPETSETISAGVTITPSWLDGFRGEVSYNHTDYTNRISNYDFLESVLPAEEFGLLEDFFQRDADGNLTSVTFQAINVARSVNETLDFNLEYSHDTPIGSFYWQVYLSYVLDRFDQLSPGSRQISTIGTVSGDDRYRLQGQMSYSNGPFDLNAIVNHTPAYDNNTFEQNFVIDLPTVRADARTTVDLTARYQLENGLIIRAGGRNIFNASVTNNGAYSASGFPYDSTRVDLRGRVLFVEASWDFAQLFGG